MFRFAKMSGLDVCAFLESGYTLQVNRELHVFYMCGIEGIYSEISLRRNLSWAETCLRRTKFRSRQHCPRIQITPLRRRTDKRGKFPWSRGPPLGRFNFIWITLIRIWGEWIFYNRSKPYKLLFIVKAQSESRNYICVHRLLLISNWLTY